MFFLVSTTASISPFVMHLGLLSRSVHSGSKAQSKIKICMTKIWLLWAYNMLQTAHEHYIVYSRRNKLHMTLNSSVRSLHEPSWIYGMLFEPVKPECPRNVNVFSDFPPFFGVLGLLDIWAWKSIKTILERDTLSSSILKYTKDNCVNLTLACEYLDGQKGPVFLEHFIRLRSERFCVSSNKTIIIIVYAIVPFYCQTMDAPQVKLLVALIPSN